MDYAVINTGPLYLGSVSPSIADASHLNHSLNMGYRELSKVVDTFRMGKPARLALSILYRYQV